MLLVNILYYLHVIQWIPRPWLSIFKMAASTSHVSYKSCNNSESSKSGCGFYQNFGCLLAYSFLSYCSQLPEVGGGASITDAASNTEFTLHNLLYATSCERPRGFKSGMI